MTTKHFRSIAVFIVSMIVFYLAVAFVELEFSFIKWSLDARTAFIIPGGLLSILITAIYHIESNTQNPQQ